MVSRAGAKAQFTRFGGTQGGLFNTFLNRALLTESARKRSYGQDIERAREALTMGGQVFDRGLGLRRDISEARLGLHGRMFSDRSAQRWEGFNAMRPSSFELFLSHTLPIVSGGLMGLARMRAMKKAFEEIQRLYAGNAVDTRADTVKKMLEDYGYDPMAKYKQPAFYTPNRLTRYGRGY